MKDPLDIYEDMVEILQIFIDFKKVFHGDLCVTINSVATMICNSIMVRSLESHNQQLVSWVYLYLITAAAENTLVSMGNEFSTCVFFESKTNRTSVQTDCTI